MKIGGASAEITWKGFGPSADSADSLNDTEIEIPYSVEQTVWTSWWTVPGGFSWADTASKITVTDNLGPVTLQLYIQATSNNYVQPTIWADNSGTPGSEIWLGTPKYGPFGPGWWSWELTLTEPAGPIWIGGRITDLSGGNSKIARRTSGGAGNYFRPATDPWTYYAGYDIAYKVDGGYQRVELSGTPGDYVATGTFISGVVDLGDGIQLSSVKWTSQEPSPTAIDTVPPPPKTVSVRGSDIVPTVAKGGGAWADKDVPDLTDPEWGGDAVYELLATISVGDAPRGVACDETVGKTLVTNFGADTVSVIDTASNTVGATVGVGDGPCGVACDESVGKAFVANSESNTVSVIHTSSGTVSTTISVGASPQGVACDETAGKTFVAASGVAPLTVNPTEDSYTDTLNAGINFGGDPEIQAWDVVANSRKKYGFIRFPIGEGITDAVLRLYKSGGGTGTVYVRRVLADWGEYTITWNNQPSLSGTLYSFSVGTGWNEVNITGLVQDWSEGTYPNYGLALTTVPTDHWFKFYSRGTGSPPELVLTYLPKVSVIHTASGTVSATIYVGSGPVGVACDETAGKAFVSNSGDDSVTVIHTPSNTVSATIDVGTTPEGIDCDETVGKTFVANYDSDTVSVIHTASDTVSATVEVGTNPRGVVCDETVGKTFVTNSGNDCVSVIDSSSNLVVGTISIGDSPYGIDCDESAEKVFAANNGDDSVSVISDAEEINYLLPFAEYESEDIVVPAERKRYVQFRATFWGDTS